MENDIVKFNKDFGSALVAEAKKQRQDRIKQECVAEVEKLLAGIETYREQIRKHVALFVLYEKRLQAIQDGDVSIRVSGFNRKIVYKDADLNDNADGTPPAAQRDIIDPQNLPADVRAMLPPSFYK